ncbi:hypothetical protein [Silvanigrella aquatica]|uniref:Uncharacterized protein n=1 Tax=Silvanigrella aquatica TaxID=1915309 RepID=A0A1L4D2W7_9BACT|nr:hypothetical protein [Silvanigrella aquatica]APJ04532.1 hypothetical protein AXG55_11700 [Silvanigrella aquatica]
MDTVILVFRVLFLVIGSIVGIFYILFQFYQKLPSASFKLSTTDYVIAFLIAFIFGFATNSYIGLGAFIPLLLVKYLCTKLISPTKLSGSGMWMEIDWKKLTPRGYERNVPRHIMEQMNKMIESTPKDTHFIIPRLYAIIGIRFMLRKMKKESANLPKGFTPQQQNMGMDQMTSLAQNILKLDTGKSEKKDLNIGVLKITRH